MGYQNISFCGVPSTMGYQNISMQNSNISKTEVKEHKCIIELMIDEGKVCKQMEVTRLQPTRFNRFPIFCCIESILTVTLLVDLHRLGSFSFGQRRHPCFQLFLSYLISTPTFLLTATINLSTVQINLFNIHN